MNRAPARVSLSLALLLMLLVLVPVHGGNNRWTSGGPFGGSFSQFAFHPQNQKLIFVSGKSVYRSTNGGAAWERMTVDIGSTADPNSDKDFGSIVRIHPQDPDTVLAAGSFVFSSTNLGETWREIAALPFQGSRLFDMEFHPRDPGIVAGVSDSRGVFISADGGSTWVARNNGMNPIGGVQIEFDPADGDILYVLQKSGRFWKSTDRGGSWKPFNSGLSATRGRGLAADPKRSGVLYLASLDQVFKTTNGGGQWTRTNCNCRLEALAVDPNDTRFVYGAGEDAVRSLDGGSTWKRMNLPRLSETRLLGVAVDPYVRNSVLIGSQGEGLFRSVNAGISWSRANDGLDALTIRNFSLSGRAPKQLFAVGQIELFRSTNAGASWSPGYRGTSPLDQTFVVQVHPQNGSLVVAGGCCTIAVSANGGVSYRNTTLTSSGIPLAAGTLALDPLSQNRMLIASLLSTGFSPLGLLRSTDQGRTFHPANIGLDTSQKIRVIVPDPKTGQVVLLGTKGGRIYRSTNGGSTWTNSSNGLRGDDAVSISFDPDDIRNAYAVSGRFLNRSTNGGISWKMSPLGLNATPTFVAVDTFDPSRIFAGTFGGLLVSRDHGATWSAFSSSGLGTFLVNSMMNDPQGPNSFYVGTERGVYHYRIAPPSSGPNVPLIDQVSPAAAPSGSVVVIRGANFGASQGSSRVSFGGADAGTAASWSDNRIQVNVPSSGQTGDVTVTTPAGPSNGYELVLLSPIIGAVQPAGGPVAGGTRVSIRAAGVRFISQVFWVEFGKDVCSYQQLTPPDAITCISPPGNDTVDVNVVSITGGRTKVGTFTYQ